MNARNRFGQTPLIAAIVSGNIEIIKLLIDSGADISRIDSRFFKTPLMHAAERNSCEAVKLLVNKGADVNFRQKRRSWVTALLWAVYWGHYECAKMLIEAGADVNVTADTGESGLIFTTRHDDIKCAKLLLCAGAMVNVRDTHGLNAIERCIIERRYIYSPSGIDLIRILFAAGEEINDKTMSWLWREAPPLVPSPGRNLNMSPRLADMCRDRIRDHLMEVSNVNLFVRTNELGLPKVLARYLVYDEDLETGADQ